MCTFHFPATVKMHSLVGVVHSHSSAASHREPGALRTFRGEAKSARPSHPLETALLLVVAAWLCFLPWALGAMYVWGQGIALGLAVAGFALSVMKRRYGASISPTGASFNLIMWPRLVRFPVFWLGLGFLAYIAIGGFNPAYYYNNDARGWWLAAGTPVKWLPAGVGAPFSGMNAWRVLFVYGGIWLLACAIWVGFTRRSTVVTLLTIVVANGTVLAVIGILQRVTEAKKVLWCISKPGLSFVSTLLYKNHAGAYFNLIVAASCVLMAWHFLRAARRMQRSSPAPIFAFCAIIGTLLVFLSNSRAAAILLAGFILMIVIGYFVWLLSGKQEAQNRIVGLLGPGCFAVLMIVACQFLNVENSLRRIERIFKEDQVNSVEWRQLARKATFRMAGDSPVYGWGAGSFRHVFPAYQRDYPMIYKQGRHILHWEYAHNDYAQGFAELGLVGLLFPASMLGYWMVSFIRRGVLWRIPMLTGVAGLGLTLVHSWVDFQAHNPAVLGTWCLLWVIYGRWMQLEPAE
jgi:O-antigen ligase